MKRLFPCTYYLVLFVFCINSFCGFSQKLNIRHYGVVNGLPSSECYWVLQDTKGYIWIATDAGVVKYDGYTFLAYTGTKGLPDNTVFKMHEDKHGRIWFSSYSGRLSYYLHETDSIYTIPVNEQLCKYANSAPGDFYVDSKDTIWYSFALNSYVKVIPPAYTSYETHKIPGTCLFALETDPGKFLPGCNFNTVVRRSDFFLLKKNYAQRTLRPACKLNTYLIHLHTAEAKDGTDYFTNGQSILKISDHKVTIAIDSVRTFANINSIYIDSKNNFFVCTSDMGLLIYPDRNLKASPRQLLPLENISCVMEDKDGGVWISTLNHGIYYIPSFSIFTLSTEKAEFALLHKGVFYYNTEKRKLVMTTIADTIQHTLGNTATWMIQRNGQQLLVCESESYIYDLSTGQKKYFYIKMNDGKNIHVSIRCASVVNKSSFAMIDNTLGALSLLTKEKEWVDRLAEDVPQAFSLTVLNDTFYIGTKLGLYKTNKGVLKKIPLAGIPPVSRITSVCNVSDTLLVATKEYGLVGVYKDRTIFRRTEKDGLLSNVCKSVVTDQDKNLWVGTNKGLTCFLYNGGRYNKHRNFTIHDGLNSNEIGFLSCTVDTLCVAGNGGVNYFSISEVLSQKYTIPERIEKCLVNGKVMNDLDGKELEPAANNIRIFFKALFPMEEGDIIYSYKLQGVDSAWTISGNTDVQYTALPPGAYRFIVSIVSEDGNIVKPAEISFVICEPVYTTWWFILLCIVTGWILLFFIYKIIARYIGEKEKRKNEKERIYIESELKALRSQMNPHFIFNAINSIQHFVIKNESANAQKYLTKFSRLIRSVLEHSRKESILLADEINTLRLYMELEALRASFGFDYEIEIDPALERRVLFIPSMLLQPFVENAILHGLLPLSERRGKLTVTFTEQDETTLVCVISDNGIGREKAMELKRKKDLNRESIGMDMTSQRIQHLNRHASFRISLLIEDRTENNEATGTTVTIRINHQHHERTDH